MESRPDRLRFVPRWDPLRGQFTVRIIGPKQQTKRPSRKSKMERRRIRRRHEAGRKPKRERRPETGRSMRYMGTGVRR